MSLKILLVEDNLLNRELAETLLEVAGHKVVVATTGKEFRAHVASGLIPDLILMDILLPDVTGTNLLAELRAAGALPGVPVIALTAQALSDDTPRFLAAGFDTVLTKPINTRTFASEVASWVTGRTRKAL